MAERTISVNALPAKTYRFLQVNDSSLMLPEGLAQYRDAWAPLRIVRLPAQVPPGKSVEKTDAAAREDSFGASAAENTGLTLTRVPFAALPEQLRGISGGMGPAVDALYREQGIETAVLTVDSFGSTVLLPTEIVCGTSALASLGIHMRKASEAAVILDITGGAEGCAQARSFFGLSIRVLAEEGATLHLICVQRLGQRVTHFLDVGGLCGSGVVDMTTLTLGGGSNHLGVHLTLTGDGAQFRNGSGYYCRGNSTLDINYVADQQGTNTKSDMIFRGVLDDHARKTWRGTIDFKSGSAGSVGDEQEDTLLLSPEVVNRCVPVILCGEEDVEGRHGATIGQLSEEMLFYMSSRGYSAEEARRLIVQARLKSVAREIPDERLRWEVEQWIEREVG